MDERTLPVGSTLKALLTVPGNGEVRTGTVWGREISSVFEQQRDQPSREEVCLAKCMARAGLGLCSWVVFWAPQEATDDSEGLKWVRRKAMSSESW